MTNWATYPLEVMARDHVLNDEEVRMMCARISALEAELAAARRCPLCGGRTQEIAVKVKPLVWDDYSEPDGFVISKAVTPLGTYFIVDDVDDFTGLYCEFISHKDATWYGTVGPSTTVICDHQHVDCPAPIKAAAQADYERRILSALECAPVQSAQPATSAPFVATYRNYRGEVSERTITPKRVWYGSTEWHPEPCWLLTALDHDKGADRYFALADFSPARPSVAEAAVSEHFHDEQVRIWTQEILEALALHDQYRPETYDDKVVANEVIARELVDIGKAIDTMRMTSRAALRALAGEDGQ